jgi:hypothetical protein
MSERYVIKDRWIFDTKLNKNIHSIDCYEEKSVLDIMNGQDQRIAELEEQLKYAIVLNLKVGQEVYVIENKNIFKDVLEEIEITEDGILFYVEEGIYGLEENEIFATKEEAEAKLKCQKV